MWKVFSRPLSSVAMRYCPMPRPVKVCAVKTKMLAAAASPRAAGAT
jgi:hypothetical protein